MALSLQKLIARACDIEAHEVRSTLASFGPFHISVFWSFMADTFSRPRATRLSGFIGAGAGTGAIIPRPECGVVSTGFQVEGTLGRAIVDGRDEVRIHGSPVRVAARVRAEAAAPRVRLDLGVAA